MNKSMKKAACVLLSAVFALSFAGCGRNKEESAENYVYSAKNIPIPSEIIAWNARLMDDCAALFDGFGVTNVPYDGGAEERVVFSETEAFFCFDQAQNGDYAAVGAVYDGESEETYTIKELFVSRFGSDGTALGKTTLESETLADEENAYPYSLIADGGYYYIQTMKGVYIFDEAGSLVYSVLEEDNQTFYQSLFRLGDGRVASNSWGVKGGEWFLIIRVFAPASKDAEEYKIPIAGNSNDCIVTDGGAYDFLLCDSTGVYEYSLESGEKRLVMNFLEHGIDVGQLTNIRLLPSGDIAYMFKGEANAAGELTLYSRIDPNDPNAAPEKKTITLAAMEVDYWLKTYIAEFNKNSAEYKIETKTYLQDGGDYDSALKKFNAELMAGNIPDVIVCGDNMAFQSYIRKGIFADLYEIMDADPDFNKADYLPNVFEALEQNGKLHTIFPMFTISSLAAKTSDVGETPGWDIDEFAAFLESKPEARHIIGEYTKYDFIETMITYYFTDPKTGECHFDREAFGKILAAAERFPKNGLSPDTDYLGFLTGAKNGDPLMLRDSLNNRLRSLKVTEVVYFGEDFTFKGFPVPEGVGSGFYPCARFAVSQNAAEKDGAWAFIKYMLDEYKDEYGFYMPIKIADLERLAHEATLTPVHGGVEYDYVVSIAGTSDNGESSVMNDILVGNNSEEDNARGMALITSTNRVVTRNSAVGKIISEEVGAYLAGQKTPDQIMDIIEDRVNLYIAEQS